MKKYVIALDQGTTSSRALLITRGGRVAGCAQRPFPQLYPRPGWVEHDPHDILSSQFGALTELLVAQSVRPEEIDAIGITNQRETTLLWDRTTGEPLSNAIVWQCRRTAPFMEKLTADAEVVREIKERTGLVPDAYFSASKLAWLLDEIPGARARALAGDLAFGTVDSWLLWKLTNGKVHATDVTNASRTMLYNIHTNEWDPYLLKLFDIPEALLPEVHPSAYHYGVMEYPGLIQGVPITGMAGDQQAALFGQCCFSAGQAKNTYGTGCFLLMHTGYQACTSAQGLITTVAASAPQVTKTEYALEGSVFMAGALIQWLRDELGIIQNVKETDALARQVPDAGGVVVVPAHAGLGAPWWDAEARGALLGLTRGTNKAHIVRASLEALAYQVCDLVIAMSEDAGILPRFLKVDGGASSNDFLMQYQADMLGCPLRRPTNAEATGLGSAFLAGLTTGFWESTTQLSTLQEGEGLFLPTLSDAERALRLNRWHSAIACVQAFPSLD
jgi:glycerol kinase